MEHTGHKNNEMLVGFLFRAMHLFSVETFSLSVCVTLTPHKIPEPHFDRTACIVDDICIWIWQLIGLKSRSLDVCSACKRHKRRKEKWKCTRYSTVKVNPTCIGYNRPIVNSTIIFSSAFLFHNCHYCWFRNCKFIHDDFIERVFIVNVFCIWRYVHIDSSVSLAASTQMNYYYYLFSLIFCVFAALFSVSKRNSNGFPIFALWSGDCVRELLRVCVWMGSCVCVGAFVSHEMPLYSRRSSSSNLINANSTLYGHPTMDDINKLIIT